MFRHYGTIAFAWFEGVVEDRQDPLKLGRVRVRCVGYHTSEKSQIPVEELHWAQVMMPVTGGAMSGISETPALVEGTMVIGFFRDTHNMQDPVVIGAVNGVPQQPNYSKGFSDPREERSGAPKLPDSLETPTDGSGTSLTSQDPKRYPIDEFIDEPDIHRLARGEQDTQPLNFKQQLRDSQTGIPSASHQATNATQAGDSTNEGESFDQPEVPYAATFPYNKVHGTESGHVFEADDTPGSERINQQHRTGTSREIHPDGTVTDVGVQNRFTVTHKDDREHVEGSQFVTVDKGQRVFINADEESDGVVVEVGAGGSYSITVNEGDCNLNVTGDLNIKVDGNENEHVTGNVTRLVEGNVDETIQGNVTRTVEGMTEETRQGPSTYTYEATLDVTVQGATSYTYQATLDVTGQGPTTYTYQATLAVTGQGPATYTYQANMDTTVMGPASFTFNAPVTEMGAASFTAQYGGNYTITAPLISLN